MNNVNALKQYMTKAGDLKRLQHRLKVIDLKLDNWDKVKAATITDMPAHHDTEHGDKIGDIVASREELYNERDRIELEVAELNSFIIDIDCKLDLMDYALRWILEKIYKQGYWGNRSKEALHELYVKEIGIMEKNTFRRTVWIARNEFNKIK